MDHPNDNKHLMVKRGSSKAAPGLLDSSHHVANDNNPDDDECL